MPGKMSAEWWREYRARNRERLSEQQKERRRLKPRTKEQRHAEHLRYYVRKERGDGPEPLPVLYPELQHGKAIAFWEDELRMDLAQERHLAMLEGRCPDAAVRDYRVREQMWLRATCPYKLDEREDG